jgi:hypothetical protein
MNLSSHLKSLHIAESAVLSLENMSMTKKVTLQAPLQNYFHAITTVTMLSTMDQNNLNNFFRHLATVTM